MYVAGSTRLHADHGDLEARQHAAASDWQLKGIVGGLHDDDGFPVLGPDPDADAHGGAGLGAGALPLGEIDVSQAVRPLGQLAPLDAGYLARIALRQSWRGEREGEQEEGEAHEDSVGVEPCNPRRGDGPRSSQALALIPG
ncbi:MAG: hypothetical protein EA397_02795 [Deltaproteobacteria bacterium]|nr:MAG: hypothetical protein EA397_02795 [Deltaproteobacteria bacterium]